MKVFSFIIVCVLIVDKAKAQTTSLDCPDGWVEFATHCYYFSDENLVYDEADVACWSNGSKLVSVETYQEHKFISDWLETTSEFARNRYYLTSGKREGFGHPFTHSVFWDGIKQRHYGPAFWLEMPLGDKSYRIAYSYSDDEYLWNNVTSSSRGGFICEMDKSDVQDPAVLRRDKFYGRYSTDLNANIQGPTIVKQPESIIVFETVQTVCIEIVALGNPAVTFTFWRGKSFSDATQVFPNKRYTISGGKLTISDPKEREDEDMYFAIVSNDIGAVISEMAEIIFGYLGRFPNIELEPVVATAFTGAKLECNEPSHSPRVTYHWFENITLGMHIWEDSPIPNFFVSYSGALYISEVQPTDADRKYYCVVTLASEEDTKLGEGNLPSRTSLGQWLYLSDQHATSDNDYAPIIHTHIFPSNPEVGKRVRLECIAYGRLPLTYSWHRDDGQAFVPGTTLSDSSRVLTIENTPLEAEGTYTCRCTSESGMTESENILLSLNAKPYFPYPIQDMMVDAGMTIRWYCKAIGRPEPFYTWYKDGERLHPAGNHRHIEGGILTIYAIDAKRDEGMYQCAATNSFGTTFSSGQLAVLSFKPTFNRQRLQSTTFTGVGANVTIPCNFEAAPVPDVLWRKNSADMKLQRGQLNGRFGMNMLYGLVISSVEHSDGALYTCEVTNIHGEAEDSTRLMVADGISFIQKPGPTVSVVNKTVFIPCQAAYGQLYDIAYIWKFNGNPIDTRLSREYLLGRQTSTSGLYIRPVGFRNAGLYECEARTPFHSVSSSAYLTVEGPPKAPAGVYVDFDSITSRSVLIIWTVTPGHSGSPTGYDIEADTTFDPNVWKIVASDIPDTDAADEAVKLGARSDQRAHTVLWLTPNTGYRFRIITINQYGRGQEASLPSAIVKLSALAPVKAPDHVGGGGGSVGTLTISWRPMNKSEYCGPGFGYNIYWKVENSTKDWKKEIGTDAMALEQGKFVVTVGVNNFYLPYKVKIGAFNNLGRGPNSSEVTVYSAEGMPVAVPKALPSKKVNGTSIIVRWEPVPNTREAIFGQVKGYRVYYYPNLYSEEPFNKEPDPIRNEILSKDVYGQTDHCQLIGLRMATEYFSRVQVFNGAGFGPKGEWRRSETDREIIKERPLSVNVFPVNKHSIRVTWRGIIRQRYKEATIRGYKIRVWKLQDDVRTAVDTVVDRVQEAVVDGLQTKEIYVVRVLGYSSAGDGSQSEAAYFSILDDQVVKFPMDPTTSELCILINQEKTCNNAAQRMILQHSNLITVMINFMLLLKITIC